MMTLKVRTRFQPDRNISVSNQLSLIACVAISFAGDAGLDPQNNFTEDFTSLSHKLQNLGPVLEPTYL